MYGFSLQNGRYAHEVEIGRVGTGADADLVDLDSADLLQAFDVVGAVRAGSQRLQRGEVNGDFFIVNGASGQRKAPPSPGRAPAPGKSCASTSSEGKM